MNINDVLQIVNDPKFSTIKLTGFIDAAIIKEIRPVIDEKLSPSCNIIIVDLEEAEFLDSHGVGFFVSLLKKVHAKKGKLIFVGAHDQPESVLKMVGFNNDIVTYCENMEQATKLVDN